MMTQRTLRLWTLIHKWTSLVSTLFLLLLCITGLPLVFHEEIGPHLNLADLAPSTPPGSLDQIVAEARRARPDETVPFVFFDDHDPVVKVATAATLDAPPDDFYYQIFDLRSGARVDAPQPNETFLYIIERLHVDLFAGLPGTLFLGLIALLLLVAIVSGVVVYAPFMRKLDFGAIRTERSRRVRWLDLHNLLGIVTVAWLAVVGLTGTINTLAQPIEEIWQANQLSEAIRPYANVPPPDEFSSLDAAVDKALAAMPGMELTSIAFPGTAFAGDHHYGVFLVGNTPVTSRLLTPMLVDASTGSLTGRVQMPWYTKMLFLSQPLHFGDYGGLPLKIVWALLDIITIVLLVTGLYLWARRPRTAMTHASDAGRGSGKLNQEGLSI